MHHLVLLAASAVAVVGFVQELGAGLAAGVEDGGDGPVAVQRPGHGGVHGAVDEGLPRSGQAPDAQAQLGREALELVEGGREGLAEVYGAEFAEEGLFCCWCGHGDVTEMLMRYGETILGTVCWVNFNYF